MLYVSVDVTHISVDVIYVSVDVTHVSVDVIYVSVDVTHVSVDVINVSVDVTHVSVNVIYVSVDIAHVSVDDTEISVEEPSSPFSKSMSFCRTTTLITVVSTHDMNQGSIRTILLSIKIITPSYRFTSLNISN
jgi:hypothetical protein